VFRCELAALVYAEDLPGTYQQCFRFVLGEKAPPDRLLNDPVALVGFAFVVDAQLTR
jgi:hypothetical protein